MPTETSTDYTPTEPGEENLFCLETVREPEISLMVKPINPKNSEFDMKNATPEEIDGFKVSDNLECKTITEGRQGDCRGRGQQSSTTISRSNFALTNHQTEETHARGRQLEIQKSLVLARPS